MPKKTEELKEIKENEKEVKATSKKATTAKKKTSTKKASTSAAKKKNASTKTTTSKKSATKKAAASTTAKKKTTSKKTTTTKSKKATTSKTAKKPIIEPAEYYDLPYRYNQTTVRLLSQTPTSLFIYWDISDEDRENYKKTYGDNFFNETKPVLIVYNDTLGYNFEVDINDFANSWYLHVNDSKCDYRVELGRRPITKNINIDNSYLYISSSNEIESPNDKVLFNNDEHMVYFRNTKTNAQYGKTISFIRNMGKIYNISDLYKTIYKDEDIDNLSNISSTFK